MNHPITPERVFELLGGHQVTAVLRTAIELDLFSIIAAGHDSAGAAAAAVEADPRTTRMLCDSLTVLGLLTKTAGRYALAPDAERFLDRRSPAYLGSVIEFLLAPEMTARWQDLTAIVRRGGPPDAGTLEPEDPVWVKFARGMAPMMAPAAEALAKLLCAEAPPRRVLDVAAGHGLFGIAVARHAPEARITALDWRPVLAVAAENAAKAGVADRHAGLPGSAFEVELGTGYDLVLLTNFLHHFDPPTCAALLRRIHAALAPGGRVAALEFVPDDDRVSPKGPALFVLNMLVGTPKGDAYTFRELAAMFQEAGFGACDIQDVPTSPERVVVARKA